MQKSEKLCTYLIWCGLVAIIDSQYDLRRERKKGLSMKIKWRKLWTEQEKVKTKHKHAIQQNNLVKFKFEE